jgi:MADS-box transcription factor, plant
MPRVKVKVQLIESRLARRITFSRRCNGLLKKANELVILCNAQVGVIVFSEDNHYHGFAHPRYLFVLSGIV